MNNRIILISALVAAAAPLAYYLKSPRSKPPSHPPYIKGKKNTVLFLVNSEDGLSNVHLATASALLENHPDITIHYASISPSLGIRLSRISSMAQQRTPSATAITYHEIQGISFVLAMVQTMPPGRSFISPPASKGIATLTDDFQIWISPWTAEQHMEIYEQLGKLIDEVDPGVVVLDTWFRPAIDVTRDNHRRHAIVTPNILADNFLGKQPLGKMFWKYPAAASGFPFPVPILNILENIYLNMRFIYGATYTPILSAKRSALRKHGLKDPINFFDIHRTDAPWITVTTEDATVPLEFVPENVHCVGPIVLSGASEEEQDGQLAAWLRKGETVLVNLGSQFAYDEQRATVLAQAIAHVLAETKYQVLWKFKTTGDFSLPFLQPYIDSDRLRTPSWLTADPPALLETGAIILSVHHGGSGCYHEAIAAGVPQLILPMWADLYNYAALVENIGVGLWACRKTSPEWTSEVLGSDMMRVLGKGEQGVRIREKARGLGEVVRKRGEGRDHAARIISELAGAE